MKKLVRGSTNVYVLELVRLTRYQWFVVAGPRSSGQRWLWRQVGGSSGSCCASSSKEKSASGCRCGTKLERPPAVVVEAPAAPVAPVAPVVTSVAPVAPVVAPPAAS